MVFADICIPCIGRWETFAACVKRAFTTYVEKPSPQGGVMFIEKSKNSVPLRLILVDDASGKEDVEFSKLVPPGVQTLVVRNPAKFYYARCVNKALAQSRAQWFIVVHPTVDILTKEWVQQMVRPLTMDHNSFMLGVQFFEGENEKLTRGDGATIGRMDMKPYRLTPRSTPLDRRLVAFRRTGLEHLGGLPIAFPNETHGDLGRLQGEVLGRGWSVWEDDSLRVTATESDEPEVSSQLMSEILTRQVLA